MFPLHQFQWIMCFSKNLWGVQKAEMGGEGCGNDNFITAIIDVTTLN